MTERIPPKIDDAPGLRWLPRMEPLGWIAVWQCRTDLARKGFKPTKRRLLFIGENPEPAELQYIAEGCQSLQDEMLAYGLEQRGTPKAPVFDGTLRNLIYCYQTDKESPYQAIRWYTRERYDFNCKRLATDHGDELLAGIRARQIIRWYGEWSKIGLPTARAMMGQLRMVLGFGASIIEDVECQRIRGLIASMRFKGPKKREEFLDFEQANAVRLMARKMESPSIGLAQVFQFEGTMRQRDTIGEWVPIGEPGMSEITDRGTGGNWKWLRGMRWNEIDSNLIFLHETSKKEKPIEINLLLAPMIMEELTLLYPGLVELDENGEVVAIHREVLPASGPIIVREDDGIPWRAASFRKRWREIATAAGVPKHIFNMDSRAGAITEATESGASLDDVRHAAAHSNIAMTQHYSRNRAKRTAKVMEQRVAARVNKAGT